MAANKDTPIPSFATLSTEEQAYFATGGENTSVAAPAVEPDPEPDLQPAEPATEPEPEPEPQLEPAELEPEPEPLAADDEQPEIPPADVRQPPRTAPIPALQAERQRRQELERLLQQREQELLQRREWQARIDERLRVLHEQNQRAAQLGQPAPPDRNTDPEAYRDYMDQVREQRIIALEQRLAQTEQGGREGQLMTNVASMTQTFAARTPDYHETVGQLRQKLEEDLIIGGYNDPDERQVMINAWSDPIIRKSLAQGMNPAEAIYKIGKARLGTSAMTPQARAVAPPSQASRVAQLRKGQTATRSLGRAPAKDMADGLTLQKLLDATETEFARYMREQPAAVNALMGK